MAHRHIPAHMLDSVVRSTRLPGEPPSASHQYAVLTNHAASWHLHIVRHRNVLATCDLSAALLPAAILSQPPCAVTLDIRYTYTHAQRRLHILLLIDHHWLVINQSAVDAVGGDTLRLAHADADVRQFTVVPDPDGDAGSVSVCLTSASTGGRVDRPLREYTTVAAAAATNRRSADGLGPIGQLMLDGLLKARTELAASRLSSERQALQLGEVQRFGPASLRGPSVDEKQMLARYGDIWVRMHLDQLVIGVPVFNCTFKR